MPALSEDDIKSIFLPYLREFYRFRYEYQPGTEQASLDNITTEGYVADGMISFEKPDGSPFVCTYEATSADKIEEVKYSLNQSYFIWDCMAFGAFVAALAYAFFYITDSEFVANLSFMGKCGMPVGIGFIAFFIWYFTMRNWKKYRYIYAIEQFKRYYADEQWVALSEDVFPAITSPYFLELKDQCIYQGVGLAIVYTDRQVRPMAAPSRLGVFGQNRKMAHWITNSRLYQSMATNVKAATSLQTKRNGFFFQLRQTLLRPIYRFVLNPLQRALGKTAQPASDFYKRFTGEYLVQKWVLTLSLIIVAAVSNAAKKHQDVIDIERVPDIYREEPPPESPEHDGRYVRNEGELTIPFGKTYQQETSAGIPHQNEETLTYRPTDNADNTGRSPIEKPARASRSVVPPPAPPKTTTSLCEKVRKAGGWYIQDNQFSVKERAEIRVAALKKANIPCDYFSGDCLGREGWIVRLGKNYTSEKAARDKAAEWSNSLNKAGLKTGIPLSKKITE
jgi:hypothetical protein